MTGPEALLASLTAGAVRVYEELCTLARLNGGKVYPSYDRLATATALGRATVARALTILEQAGFLVRQRRFRRVEGGAGAALRADVQRLSPGQPQAPAGAAPALAAPGPGSRRRPPARKRRSRGAGTAEGAADVPGIGAVDDQWRTGARAGAVGCELGCNALFTRVSWRS
ncbi:helix-turn-helix domain-containing protein [Sphingomonas sp. I4]